MLSAEIREEAENEGVDGCGNSPMAAIFGA